MAGQEINLVDSPTVKWTKGPQSGTDPVFDLPIFPVHADVQQVSTVGITVDGGAAIPTTGLQGFIQVPFGGTIIGWSIVAKQTGSVSVEIWKAASSAPPAAPVIPNSGNKISAAAPCALSSAQSAAVGASGVSTWGTAVAAWDVFAFQMNSIATITRFTLGIQIQRS